MRKAINFDIDTKKYEEYVKRPSPVAYRKIRNFLYKNGFEHRQGSGYVSKNTLDDRNIIAIITKLSMDFNWLKYCVKEIDVTNVGKQHSLVTTINQVSNDNETEYLEI